MCFYSCNNRAFNNEEELVAFIEDESNGYIQHKTVNGVNFSLMYRPTDLLVKQEFGNRKVTKVELKELKKKYEKFMYFNLSMSKNGQELLSVAPKDRYEFGVMVNQLTFEMNEKVYLYTKSKDTLDMVDFVYPRMYGISKATTLMFVYPKEKLNEEFLNFTIQDIGLFTGEVKFKIPTKRIKNEPQLAFKHTSK
jgi:hypothetical protein